MAKIDLKEKEEIKSKKKQRVKLSVIIPIHNEKETLAKIVKKVQDVNVDKEIIMVDDCSKDGSREIEDKLAGLWDNIKVYKQNKNQGKGAALRLGFKKATGKYVIVQDADLEYDPRDYRKLLAIVDNDISEIVYGSRFLGADRKSMTLTHTLGNKLLTLLTNILYNTSLSDMETCYKLFPRKVIQSIDFKSNRFNFEPEITAKILKKKYRIYEVPIRYYGRDWDEGKKISWRDGFAGLWALIKYRFMD